MGDKSKPQPKQGGAAGSFQKKAVRDSQGKQTPPPKPKR